MNNYIGKQVMTPSANHLKNIQKLKNVQQNINKTKINNFNLD